MTIRMSSAVLGASSLDSSSSFVEIDSDNDNATSRSSSHDDDPRNTNTADIVHLRSQTSHSVDDVPTVNETNNCGVDSSDDVDTKPNVSDFMTQSEHFLKNNFVTMGNGLGGHVHPHHHHHAYPGLSAALQSYHQQQHHSHNTAHSTVSSSIAPVGISCRPGGVSFGGGTSSGNHHHGSGNHSRPTSAKPPFMQLYKSLFANAVLQNPDKMSSAGFARNVLFTCGGGAERSPPESDGEVDEKGSLADEVYGWMGLVII